MGVRDSASAIYRVEPESAQTCGGEVPRGYKRTDVGVIPQDWILRRLDEISAFITKGATPTTYGFEWQQSGILFLRSECVAETGLNLAESMLISDAAYLMLQRSHINTGDLLVTITGNVGRVVRYQHTEPAAINQHIARVRISADDVAPNFVFYWLSQSSVRSTYNSITTGQAYPQISLTQVRETQVGLPPTKIEQEAIAEALGDTDALIESLQQLIAKKRAVKQGAMQALLTGRQRLPGFTGEWHMVPFGRVAALRRERIDPRLSSVSKFCVELEHIEARTGRLLAYGTTNPSSSLKTVFQKGDVLFGKLRAYLRKSWHADREGVCSTEIWSLYPIGDLVSSDLLFQLVQTDAFIEAASESYGTHMPRSDWRVVSECVVAISLDEEEQSAIAAVLSDMDVEIEALEARLAKTRALKDGMMQTLLTGMIRLPLDRAA